MAIYKPEQLLKSRGLTKDSVRSVGLPQTTQQGNETWNDIKQTGSSLLEDAKKRSSNVGASFEAYSQGKQGLGTTIGQFAGQSAGLGSDVFGAATKGVVKATLSQESEDKLMEGVKKISEKIGENESVKNIVEKYNQLDPVTKRNIDAALGVGSLVLDVATLGGGKKVLEVGTKKALETAGKVVESVKPLVGDAVDLTKRATAKIIEKGTTPKPSALEATGQVLQGTTKDVQAGIKALSTLDTTGVKTFGQLEETIGKRIAKLAEQVDSDLGGDATKRALKDLAVSAKTTGGKIVKSNPVQTALKHLNELYKKIGDGVEAANIKELYNIAIKKGLTRQEINDIARVYGEKFGEKAFGKLGEPLTTVNAQLYENTRKALKNLARDGIKGAKAKKADALMSSLYKTKTLVTKSVEAVNKLQQRINERGLLEKVGNAVAKYGDILTGGSLRGFVGGLLPRGAGYKVMNALDIEKALESNLKIIQDAIKAGNDAEIVKILKNLSLPKK